MDFGGTHLLFTYCSARDDWHLAQRLRLAEKEVFIDNLLVRSHFIIVMIRWTGLAPWEFEFLFPCNLASTFLTWTTTSDNSIYSSGSFVH